MPAGKIVDHFTFKRRGKTLKVPVRLHKVAERHDGPGSSRYAGPQQTMSAQFGVDLPEFKVCLWSTDIDALREAVMDKLADHYKIKWEEYWIVQVEEGYRFGSTDGAAVELSWTAVYIGKTPAGETVHREDRDHSTSGTDIRKGWPDIENRTRRREGVRSLIPASEENTKALEGFAARLTQLRERMQEFLCPEKIEASLAQLSGLIAPELPAPSDAPIEVEAKAVHTATVSEKRPESGKKKKGEKPLPKLPKPKTMKKCKDV